MISMDEGGAGTINKNIGRSRTCPEESPPGEVPTDHGQPRVGPDLLVVLGRQNLALELRVVLQRDVCDPQVVHAALSVTDVAVSRISRKIGWETWGLVERTIEISSASSPPP